MQLLDLIGRNSALLIPAGWGDRLSHNNRNLGRVGNRRIIRTPEECKACAGFARKAGEKSPICREVVVEIGSPEDVAGDHAGLCLDRQFHQSAPFLENNAVPARRRSEDLCNAARQYVQVLGFAPGRVDRGCLSLCEAGLQYGVRSRAGRQPAHNVSKKRYVRYSVCGRPEAVQIPVSLCIGAVLVAVGGPEDSVEGDDPVWVHADHQLVVVSEVDRAHQLLGGSVSRNLEYFVPQLAHCAHKWPFFGRYEEGSDDQGKRHPGAYGSHPPHVWDKEHSAHGDGSE
mmetsp:Transcript_13715/g.30238  ORF Transcript_13715/g.30238 Transcript_13715/m.30238 type:complete len:285 (-) Transcript_13715:205-1059(-)